MNTWDELPKNQVDPEKIEEAIGRIVGDHNDDPDAHLGDNQALQSHRASEIIDHLAESVLNDKLHIPSRAYTAIVGGGDLVDFNDIQSAIDFVASVGGGSIYIVSGTYVLPNILTIPANIAIYGQSRETVFLDCAPILFAVGSATFNGTYINGASANFVAGSNIVTGVGTSWLSQGLQAGDEIGNDSSGDSLSILSINSNTSITLVSNWPYATQGGAWYLYRYGAITKNVVGVGTHWLTDGLRKGNLIKLNADGYYYRIENVISNTQLTLSDPYDDTGGYGACTSKIVPYLSAGEDYLIYAVGTITATKDSKTITGAGTLWLANASAGQTILINGTPYIIYSVNSNTSITLVDYYRGKTFAGLYYQIMSYIENISLYNFNVINCENYGAVYLRCVSNSIIDNVEVHKSYQGFYLSYCYNVTLQRSDSSRNMFSNSASGMWLIMSTRCNILYNNFSGNWFHGIATQSANFYCNIIGNTANNNGSSGIVFNALGGVGFGNNIFGNTCQNNVSNGIGVENTDYGIITDNVCSQNGGSGISLGKCNFVIIKGNQCFKNTIDGIYSNNNSYGNQINRCIISNNVIYNNTSIGILINTGGLNNLVIGNIIYLNGTNISNLGTGTVQDNNIIT